VEGRRLPHDSGAKAKAIDAWGSAAGKLMNIVFGTMPCWLCAADSGPSACRLTQADWRTV